MANSVVRFLRSVFLGGVLVVSAMEPATARAAGVVTTCTDSGLRAAVATGGLITFACGGPATIVLAGPITFTQNTTLDGGGLITLSGNNLTGLLVSNNNLSITLRDLTLRDARSTDQGAGFKVGFYNTLTIERVTFVNLISTRDANACDGGGALFIGGGGTASILDSVFSGNRASNGGAINSLRSDLTVRNSTFSGNQALHTAHLDAQGDCGGGGAIYIDGANSFSKASTSLLRGNTFTDNIANNHGGAIFIGVYANESITVDASVFRGNRATVNTQGAAGTGGGIWFGRGNPGQATPPLTLTNLSFLANHADTQGGALWVDASATLTNVTFHANEAINPASLAPDDWRRGNGGALAESLLGGEPPVALVNVTFAGNRAGFNGGAIAGDALTLRNVLFNANTGGNPWLIQQHCTNAVTNQGGTFQYPDRNPNPNFWNETNCATNLTVADPRLGPLTADTVPGLLPLFSSPALNAGVTCPVSDQRGLSRPQGAGCDSGAVELGLSVEPRAYGPGDTTVIVRGAGFGGGTHVTWDGQARATTLIDAGTLRATLLAGDVATPRTAAVGVENSGVWSTVPVAVWSQIQRLYLPVLRR
ncbi:MAG: hypothetical protein JNL73_09285 [Anaerolineales bacterium]|nr:hypothetical protein [Anaerolineales bacterium]